MSLEKYFTDLLARVESSEEIDNGGKDENGFYKPTRALLLRNLQMLKDLHAKPNAKPMVKRAWEQVVADLPSEWLVVKEPEKSELREMLR